LKGERHLAHRLAIFSSLVIQAELQSLLLVTENIKHLGKIEGINIENWVSRIDMFYKKRGLRQSLGVILFLFRKICNSYLTLSKR